MYKLILFLNVWYSRLYSNLVVSLSWLWWGLYIQNSPILFGRMVRQDDVRTRWSLTKDGFVTNVGVVLCQWRWIIVVLFATRKSLCQRRGDVALDLFGIWHGSLRYECDPEMFRSCQGRTSRLSCDLSIHRRITGLVRRYRRSTQSHRNWTHHSQITSKSQT